MSALVFAIPSKGRLKEQAEEYLAACGLKLQQEGRGYSGRFAALPQIDVRLMSSSEIASALRDGKVHVGIAGEDLLREGEPAMTRVALLQPLGFGRADLVVATPQCWVDVAVMADLDDVAHTFRARTGARLRVATKYLALTRGFFDQHGIDDYRLVESQGATEGAPTAGAAEAIVDITTTGSTLAANHLKILDDGVILRSHAHIAASRAAIWNEQNLTMLRALMDAVDSRARALDIGLLSVTIGAANASNLVRIAEKAGCSLFDDGEALVFECPAARVEEASSALLSGGAARVIAGPRHGAKTSLEKFRGECLKFA